MNIDKIRIKRMRENAVPPSRKTDGAAGWDLAACGSSDLRGYLSPECITSGESLRAKILVPLGWAFEIPQGYVGLLKPRSSRSDAFLDGVIDSDYRGEIFIPSVGLHAFEVGERIAQLVIVPVLQVGELVEVDELSDTTRGTGGHGSTGRF